MNLLQVYDAVAVDMEAVREVFATELESTEPIVLDMIEQVGKFRGKMLRPMLVLLAGKACGRVTRRHHVIGAVVEMIHMATLVHDDVLDEAAQRRRGPTLNLLHGNEAAVLFGDLLVSHAFHLAGTLDWPELTRLVGATTNTLCEGELLQLYYRHCHDLSEQRYFEIIAKKTGSLMGLCCYLGARAADADETTAQALEQYALELGSAFQIMDDVTDLAGSEAQAGKTLGLDLDKGKLTLPGIHFFARADAAGRQRMAALLGGGIDAAGRAEVKTRLEQAGSLAYARQTAEACCRHAIAALPETLDPTLRDLLVDTAGAVVA